MGRSSWLLLPLALLAVGLNLQPLQLFFDQQLMLGSSLAVLALLLLGWRGIAVGLSAYWVTWHSWGHPFELINGTTWLLVVQLFLSRFNGGPAQRGNGRLVLVTVAYWLLVGLPAEWLWFRLAMGINPTEALGLGLKELVTAVLNASLGLLLFQGLQLLNPRQRRRGLPMRGLTFSALLLAITVPGLLICLVVSNQLSHQALLTHREAMQGFGREVAALGRLAPVPPRLAGIAVQVQRPGSAAFSSDANLFSQLASTYASERRPGGQVDGMALLVPRQPLPRLLANQRAYWQTQLRRGDQRITVVQPAADLIHSLAFDDLLPSFGVVAALLVGGALVSEGVGSLINRELGWLLAGLAPQAGQPQRHGGSRSFIRELALIQKAMRRSNLAQQRANTRYRNFFNLPLVGTAITSVSKGWVEVNDATCAILGRSREQLFQSTWAELTHPDDLAADEAQFARMLRREIDGYQLEKRFIRPDGTVVHTLLAGGCGPIGSQPVDLCYVNIIDISERKQVEAELAAATAREARNEVQRRQVLEQKLKTSLTAAAVSHEIQQPLASILLNCRLALQSLDALPQAEVPAELQRRLQALTADGDRVTMTMERMRMLLRNVETEHASVDLASCIHNALVFARSELQHQRVQLNSAGLEQPCPLQGDSAQLQIAVINLIRNAIQALEAQSPASRRLQVQLQRHAQLVAIVVADSGRGFPAGYSSDTSWEMLKSTKATGMGLGLFLAQTAAANHRGTLRIGRSATLGGAEVVIELPLRAAAAAGSQLQGHADAVADSDRWALPGEAFGSTE